MYSSSTDHMMMTVEEIRSAVKTARYRQQLPKLAWKFKSTATARGQRTTLTRPGDQKFNTASDQYDVVDDIVLPDVPCCEEMNRAYYVPGSTLRLASTVVLIPAFDLTIIPKSGDLISWDGTQRKLAAVEVFRPDGITPIFYSCGLEG
jgi:hypothetical protein